MLLVRPDSTYNEKYAVRYRDGLRPTKLVKD